MGLGSVSVGGSSRRVFAVGRAEWQWRAGAEGGAGAGGELNGLEGVRIFRIGPDSMMKARSRMSPPEFGHASGNSPRTRAISSAQAIREVSCERGFARVPQQSSASRPYSSCALFAASRCLPTFPTASPATARGRLARMPRNRPRDRLRFGTEITHCRTGTGGMT